MTENEQRNIILNNLEDLAIDTILVDKEVPIPYKHIYLPTSPPKLEIWSFKQDIVFYKKLFDKSIKQKGTTINYDDTALIDVIIEKDSSQNSHHLGLPLVIIETKKKQPTTHELLTYSQKSQMIKSIFPYCKYVFLIFNKIAPRTYRHGINFDLIRSISDINNQQQINEFKKDISNLLNEVVKNWVNISEPYRIRN